MWKTQSTLNVGLINYSVLSECAIKTSVKKAQAGDLVYDGDLLVITRKSKVKSDMVIIRLECINNDNEFINSEHNYYLDGELIT